MAAPPVVLQAVQVPPVLGVPPVVLGALPVEGAPLVVVLAALPKLTVPCWTTKFCPHAMQPNLFLNASRHRTTFALNH